MNKYISRELILIQKKSYIFRCVHRTLEGDCQVEHGPICVNIGPFYVDKYPVTNKMFYDFLCQSGYEPKDKDGFLKHFVNSKFLEIDANKPVVNISHEDAENYSKFYSMRLLKDYEWQYIAEGDNHLAYPWGNCFSSDYCNANGKALTDVDKYEKVVSPFSVVDLCGNAYEMTDNVYSDGDHKFILLRGGSFHHGENYWHSEGGAMKNNAHLKVHLISGSLNRFSTVGFRCAKDIL